jgi:TATA-binding protein-associated factor Taf7
LPLAGLNFVHDRRSDRKGSAEEKALVERYVRELNEQEDRVESLRHEITEMQQKRDAAQSTLNGVVEASDGSDFVERGRRAG